MARCAGNTPVRDAAQDSSGGEKADWVGRSHAVQHPAQDAADQERGEESDRHVTRLILEQRQDKRLRAASTLGSRLGTIIVWVFNIVGTVDLLNAFYQADRFGVGTAPGLQGAAYFIPTVLVPLLLVTHGIVFRALLRPESVEIRHA